MLEFLLGNNFLLSIVAFALILIPAIIIHELGHFFAAKIVGINVLEFGVGFPPRMFRLFWWGETEFTINWLPIGGFVRPLGEDMIGPVMEDDDEYDDYDELDGKPKKITYSSEREELLARGVPEDALMSVNEAKPLARIFFMIAGALANVVSAIIVFIIAAFLGLPTEVGARVQVMNIEPNSLFDQPQVTVGDAVEQINGELFATSQAYFSALQEASGQQITLSMRRLEDDTSYEISGIAQANGITGVVHVTALVTDAPGYEAGLEPGDLILSINGKRLDSNNPVEELQAITEQNAGEPIALGIRRGNEQLTINVVPRLDPPPGQGRIGISIRQQFEIGNVRYQDANPQVEYIPQPAGVAIPYGFERTWDTLAIIASIPSRIIEGTISPEEARPVSIVGISQIGGEFLKRSIINSAPSMVLEFLALISIFLGITNLLPFPPLDGGRILFVIIEMVRGKPVPPEVENLVYRIGIALLLGLGVVVILYDIFNPISLTQ